MSSEGLIDLVMEKFVIPVMFGIVTLFAVAIVLAIPVGIYLWATYKPPETFSLRVDSWQCTRSHERDREICTKGCTWVREVVCTQWSVKGAQ